jgi:glycosyltransferase involved in cell wall biosynthesis
MRKNGVLYLSYDGILEPLGQSQVLGYLENLTHDRPIHLISFEKSEHERNFSEVEKITRRTDGAGIKWHRLRYHKRPSSLATAFDILIGTCLGVWLSFRYGLKIVHARSYVASVMALGIKAVCGTKFLFDMRGFWADERLDGKIWQNNSILYKIAKNCEKKFLLAADHVVSLTHAGVSEIQRFEYLKARQPIFSVISTCADLDLFKLPTQSPRTSGGSSFTLGYVGAAGTWYLFETLVECFYHLRTIRSDAKLLILNRGEHDYIRKVLVKWQIPNDSVELHSAEHTHVPQQIARMDAAAFFIRPLFSKKASAPTKLGELLGCGIPCLSNTGVGDMTEILKSARVGVAIPAFDSSTLRNGVEEILKLCAEPGIAERCRATAEVHFSLHHGVTSYRKIYESLDSLR